jgi:AraC family transcriptional regulator, arabinose operon regulatory protein
MTEKKEGFIGQRSYIMPNEMLSKVAQHPLLEMLHLTDIGYYPNAKFHQRERSNGCEQHIFIYCVTGEGWFEIDGQKYDVLPNYFFIIPAHKSHKYGANLENPWSIYWAHFTGNKSADYVSFLKENNESFEAIPIHPNPERNIMFDDIISHIEMSFNEDNIVYANTSFSHFLTTLKGSVFNPKPKKQNENDPIAKIIDYMKEHLNETLTLDDLASEAGMSASHFSSVFRQKVQNSPINFFTFLKIQEACRLMENSEMRIKEIAYSIGYNDPYHFSRVFTTLMGMSPRDFRRMGNN